MLAWSMFVAVTALAQETPRPAVLDVALFSNEAACPDVPSGVVPEVLATTAGVLVHQGDGTYSYGCPSRWGDPTAKVASPPDASVLYLLAAGVPYRTDNGGCTATPIPLPEGLTGVDLVWFRDTAWILAAATSEILETGGLFRWDATSGAWVEVVSWDQQFRPYSFLPGGADSLWIASVDPRVRLRRLTFLGGLGGDEVLGGMPDGFDGVTDIRPAGADEDEAWFVLKRSNESWTWHADASTGSGDAAVVFTEATERSPFVLGPVRFGEQWVSVLNNRIHTAAQNAAVWTDTGVSVTWTCLLQRGAQVYACIDGGLSVVEGLSGRPADVTPVFAFSQVAPPDPACTDLACDNDFAALSAFLGRETYDETAVCPDGRTARDLDPGCSCATGGSTGGAWLGLLGLGLLVPRRRRAD
ncbi:MAG: MYXO-CTERM sorting domain-containing protein [Alphaproteobacteria bacterium]|nr:MYXO-CTERM sorting domain-containing protein [Alphaproteobacteria bacterium]